MIRHLIFILLLSLVFPGYSQPGNTKALTDYDYYIVSDSTFVDVMESGLSYVTQRKVIRINTYKGAKEFAVIKSGYDPMSAFVKFVTAEVHPANGPVRHIDTSLTIDYPAPARMIYWGAREKMLEVGRLEPGDVLVYKIYRKGFTYALLLDDEDKYIPPMRGHFYDIVPFWNEVPVQRKSYTVVLPQDKDLQYHFFAADPEYKRTVVGDKISHHFVMKDITPLKKEKGMVNISDVGPKLLLTTSPDWLAKSVWFYNVNEEFGSFDATPEISTKVDEILEGANSEMDSISRLTHWVADEIRYSGISMGEGEGFTLHKGDMTFRDRAGVCKDKAGMLITMLRAAGFESYAAMTMAGSRIENIPADQFNHCVSVVRMSDEKLHLLDPTWVPFVRELWSSAEQQQQVLMGLPSGAPLKTTPISPPQAHYYSVSGFAEIRYDGTLHGGMVITAEGQSDANLRRYFTASPRLLWNSIIEKELKNIHPKAELIDFDLEDPYDYSERISFHIEYDIPGYATKTDQFLVFTPLIAMSLFSRINYHLNTDTSLTKRNFAFRDRCSKLIEITDIVKFPSNYSIVHLPDSLHSSGSGGNYQGYYKAGDHQLEMHQRIELPKRIYDTADWPSYREAVASQLRYSSDVVVIKNNE